MDITSKLITLRQELAELEQQLQDIAVFSNPTALKELNQRQAELRTMVELAERCTTLNKQVTELETSLRTENDLELRQLTQEELGKLTNEQTKLEAELKIDKKFSPIITPTVTYKPAY